MRELKFRFRIQLENGEIRTEYYTLSRLEVLSFPSMKWINLVTQEKDLRFSRVLSRDQYTERDDINGKELYENDIIDGKDSTPARWGGAKRWSSFEVIKWNANRTGFEPLTDSNGCDISTIVKVGDIYDNPELLGGVSDGN